MNQHKSSRLLCGAEKVLYVAGMAVAMVLFAGNMSAQGHSPYVEEGELRLAAEGSPSWNHTRTDTRVACVGNGTDGARVEFLWVTENPIGKMPVVEIRQAAAWVDRSIADSAQIHSGTYQSVRWEHTKPATDGCQVTPRKVVVPKGTIGPADNPEEGLQRVQREVMKRHNSSSDEGEGRRYLVWFDRTFSGGLCGQGTWLTYPPFYDQPGSDIFDPALNPNNDPDFQGIAHIYCPGRYNSVELHELAHTLGAVQPSALNYWDGFHGEFPGHAGDGYDVMSYAGWVKDIGCRSAEWARLLDCNANDYYNPGGKIIGSGGKEIWNIANSVFLQNEKPAWWVDYDPFAPIEGDRNTNRHGSGRFIDDDTSVFEADIEKLAAIGVTRGCNPPENTRFCPDDMVTRGQMAAFLRRALPGLAIADADAGRFSDTTSSVFADDVTWLARTGVTRGCDSARYCPDDPVTRGQMAAFLGRALRLSAGTSSFADAKGHLFEGEVVSLADAGITRGCNPPENTRFCPNDMVTRGQMAAFLVRAGVRG